MPIIYAERKVVRKDGDHFIEEYYYRDQKRISVKEFWKFLKAAREEEGQDLYEIYGGING